MTAPGGGSPLDRAPVIPVVQLPEDVEPAQAGREVATALLAGGIPVIEITLRSEGALAAVTAVRELVPDVLVGAGTVLDVGQLEAAVEAGAQFVVTPGTTAALRQALTDLPVPALPGAATVSEVMALRDAGFDEVKVFPAEPLGGPAFVRSVLAPLREVRVCPTGGITAARAAAYLEIERVPCVGGSWLTPAELVRTGDWAGITRRAQHATTTLGSALASPASVEQ
ncbi:2-keto-3-deoxy-phosphogluconate aldolase [Knoellia remsis]|uniref:2-dehydro-3-deoxy-phosphogluconate aldolase n=1 Tax=Knoellia remsis TaxID=407159 RepID=A0A2T0UJX1_9MICO|nr:bifunctional 4-hydroxy-2-oxoglutarate aldolase/2-dehydro-3-deoxy-phosphogluconate aldolase [Knoellia remsis]PRY58239.1 2-keto-3-deoxy-phosphogluconate aldolase [Knoellia remsis]